MVIFNLSIIQSLVINTQLYGQNHIILINVPQFGANFVSILFTHNVPMMYCSYCDIPLCRSAK